MTQILWITQLVGKSIPAALRILFMGGYASENYPAKNLQSRNLIILAPEETMLTSEDVREPMYPVRLLILAKVKAQKLAGRKPR